MAWLIAFLCAHAVEIAAIGGAAYAVSEVESVAVNAVTLTHELKKPAAPVTAAPRP